MLPTPVLYATAVASHSCTFSTTIGKPSAQGSQLSALSRNVVNLHTKENKITVKRICLFVNLLLILCAAGKAQLPHQPFPAKNIIDSLKLYPLRVLPNNYYFNNIGFFCKKEIQIEKATKIPFKFRLGSIDYTDYLEQKPNAIKKP